MIRYFNVYPHGRGAFSYSTRYAARLAAKGMAIYRIKVIYK